MKDKVALDIQSVFENDKTGIGWTVKKIVDHLVGRGSYSYQLNYFGRYHVKEKQPVIREYMKKGCIIKHCSWVELPVYRRIWRCIPIPYCLLFGNNIKITQFFNYVIPPGVSGKKVLFVYDMAYMAYPDTINKRTKNDMNKNLQTSCERANIICTISEFSKSEIVRYLHIEPSKIRVIPCGVDHSQFHPNYDKEKIREIKRKYGITGEYFLYLGTLEPRKNVLNIVRAYIELMEEVADSPSLVLAGKKGWLYEDIFLEVKTGGIESRIVFTGYVEDKEVPLLMNGAYAFLFPSIYEGFGLPVVEAMACGTPVITSNDTSLSEIAGNAALLVDPKNKLSIMEAMKELLLSQELYKELVYKGTIRSKVFTWKNAAVCLENIYGELLKEV